MALESLESASGVVITPQELLIASVSTGFRESTLKSSLIIEDYAAMPPVHLAEQIREAGIATDRVILGLPRDQLIIRTVELPLEVEENLGQVMQFQAEKFEPVEEGQSSFFDYVVLARDEKFKKLTVEVIMAPAGVAEETLSLMGQIGLHPTDVRVAGLSHAHLLQIHRDGFPKENPCLIVDVRSEKVTLTLVVGPGRAYSERISLSAPPDADLVMRELHLFVSQIDVPGEGLEKIYLTGDVLGEELQERFEDCESFFKGASLKTSKHTASQLSRLIDPISLALSGLSKDGAFNLLPVERRPERAKATLVPTFVLGFLVLVMIGAALGRDLVQSRQLVEALDGQIEAVSPAVEETLKLRAQIDEKRQRLAALQEQLIGNTTVMRILKELTERMPDDSYLENLTVQSQGQRVNMTGYAPRGSALLSKLQGSDCLRDVSSRFILPGPDNNEKFRFEAEPVDCGVEVKQSVEESAK